MNWCVSLLALAVIVLGNIGSTQTLTLVSLDNNEPVNGVKLKLWCPDSDEAHHYSSDPNGKIILSDLPCSTYIVTLHHPKFETITDTLTGTIDRFIQLVPLLQDLDEVVVTAQYTPGSPEKSVHKVKVIDRKTIDAMGAVNLRDVLTNQLNIRLSQDNVLGSSMSLQGVSGQNVKILIDGVAVTGRVNGNIDISQINMNNVERIEVVEGPLSVNYGTDALAGTINIITKKFEKPSSSALVSSYYESIGQYNLSGRLAHSTAKSTFSLVAGRNYFDGWKYEDKPFYIEEEKRADSTRVKDWKPKEQYFTTLFIGRRIKDLKFGLTSDYFYEQIMNRGYPRLPYFETAFDDYYTTHRFNNAFTVNGKLKARLNTNLLFAYNYYERIKNTYLKDLTTLNQVLTQTVSDQDTSQFLNFNARGSISTVRMESKWNGELGYDLQHETGLGLRIKDGKQEIGDYAVFGSLEFRPTSKTIIRPGLRAMYNTAYAAPLVPSFNIKQEVGKHSVVRFSYARGFRAPSLKDLYFYFVDINHNIKGNENLKAEYSHNFSLAFSTTFKTKSLLWKVENSSFYNDIRNLITLAQATAIEYTYFNLERFKSLGTQLQAEITIKRVTATVGGSYVGRYTALSANYTTAEFLFSPEGKLNLQYRWPERDFTTSLFYKYTGKTPGVSIDESGNLYNTSISDYHTADCSVSKSFWSKRLQLTVGAKNLFNVRNVVGVNSGSAHSAGGNSIPMAMGRTYFVKLDINLTTTK